MGAALLLAGSIISCNAPRYNPLDPAGSNYNPADSPEKINDLSYDSLLNSRCRLRWTSPEGAYEYLLYSGLPEWDGNITGAAQKYTGELPGVKPPGTPQYAWISLPPGETRGWSLISKSREGLFSEGSNVAIINAPRPDNPADVSVSAFSIHKRSWTSFDYYAIAVEATIIDPDTVDLVWVRADTLNIGSPLNRIPGSNSWYGEFQDTDLADERLGTLIGVPLSLHHLDKAGFHCVTEPFNIARIIYDAPVIVSPDVDELVDTLSPVLTWENFSADYDFTYSLEIIHVTQASGDTLIYRKEGLSPQLTTHYVETPLTAEREFLVWTISVVDNFGDISTSYEARFRIETDE